MHATKLKFVKLENIVNLQTLKVVFSPNSLSDNFLIGLSQLRHMTFVSVYFCLENAHMKQIFNKRLKLYEKAFRINWDSVCRFLNALLWLWSEYPSEACVVFFLFRVSLWNMFTPGKTVTSKSRDRDQFQETSLLLWEKNLHAKCGNSVQLWPICTKKSRYIYCTIKVNFYFINLGQERLGPYIIIRRGCIYIWSTLLNLKGIIVSI